MRAVCLRLLSGFQIWISSGLACGRLLAGFQTWDHLRAACGCLLGFKIGITRVACWWLPAGFQIWGGSACWRPAACWVSKSARLAVSWRAISVGGNVPLSVPSKKSLCDVLMLMTCYYKKPLHLLDVLGNFSLEMYQTMSHSPVILS